jgi:hypothetical protein
MLLRFMKRLWYAEQSAIHGLIGFQNKLLMTIVYLIAIFPVAVILKLMGKRLIDAPLERGKESYWEPCDDGPLTIDRAKRMF